MADGSRRKKLKALTTSWTGRTLSTARMAASAGRAGARKAWEHVRDKDADAEADEAFGTVLVENMDAMKGLMMKLGQMVSYLDGTLPPHAQKVLRKLQQGSDPLEFEVVKAVIEAAFDADLDTLFDDFEEEPMAAASIGQVHRATYDGRPVVVKVQYPGIAKTLQVDLGNLDRLGLVATLGSKMNSRDIVAELRDRMREECNYRQEASFQRVFHALYADDPEIVVPDVFPERCAGTVITSERIEGRTFYDFAETASQEEKNRAGEIIFRFAFDSIFGHSIFNADPHPGNYLFLDDGRVAFLDYGCVKFFDAAFISRWKRLAICVLEDRREELPDRMKDVGFVAGEWNWDRQWEVMQYLYLPFKTPDFRYTHDYVADSYERFFWKNPNVRKTRVPPEWLFVNRLQWGLNSVLALLHAQADWHALFRHGVDQPSVDASPPPPL